MASDGFAKSYAVSGETTEWEDILIKKGITTKEDVLLSKGLNPEDVSGQGTRETALDMQSIPTMARSVSYLDATHPICTYLYPPTPHIHDSFWKKRNQPALM